MSAILLRSPAFRNRFTFAHPARPVRHAHARRICGRHIRRLTRGRASRRDENRHDSCDTRRVEPIKDQSASSDAPESKW